MDFYRHIIRAAVEKNILEKTDSVLAICAGSYDRDVFHAAGFENVVISNLDYHSGVSAYDPFSWMAEDAEALSQRDESFDWVVVHAGLHHCASPHKALCEMLRVSKKGIVVFESRDSFLVRLGVRLGMTGEHELEPIALTGGKEGGYRNSPIPNYIYRWKEREVIKTVNSYVPTAEHRYHFHYGYNIPVQRLAMSNSLVRRIFAAGMKLLVPVLETILPRQGNQFGFIVEKSNSLHPWLQLNGSNEIEPDLDYLAAKFNTSKYRRDD